MNDKQSKIIEKLIKGKEKDILIRLLNHFLDKGLGSVSKTETDVFLFHLIDQYQKSNRLNLNNFDWSSLLKISERKIKNLRLEAGIRYASDDNDDEFHSWIALFDLIIDGYLEFEGTDKVIITIENPYTLRFIEHQLKSLKLSSADYSFNAERVKLKVSSLEQLLKTGADEIGIGKGNTDAEYKLKSAKWTNYSKEAGKQILGILAKAIPSLFKP